MGRTSPCCTGIRRPKALITRRPDTRSTASTLASPAAPATPRNIFPPSARRAAHDQGSESYLDGPLCPVAPPAMKTSTRAALGRTACNAIRPPIGRGPKIDKEHFDHSKTHYPLTGAHREVACEKCHTPGADGQPRYAGFQFSTCSTCHSDPHKGRVQAELRILPQHLYLEEIHFHLDLRPLEDEVSAAGKAPRSLVPDLPQERRLQDANGLCTNCADCHKGRAWRPVPEARGRRPVRELPHGQGLEANHLHGGGSRQDQVPAGVSPCQGEVRRLPYSGRQGDPLQDQVCALRGLPQG